MIISNHISEEVVYNPEAVWEDNRLKIINLSEITRRLISECTFNVMPDIIALDGMLPLSNVCNGT